MGGELPNTDQIQSLVARLHRECERLRAIVHDRAEDNGEVARVVDEIGSQLLLTDEELRIQSEQVAVSARRLDVLVASYEQLFAYAPVAYLQTDAAGNLVQLNHAARELLGLTKSSEQPRTLIGAVAVSDRTNVRTLISRLAAVAAPFGAAPAPAEVCLLRADGRSVPALITGRRSTDPGGERSWLHWELRERGAEPASDGQGVAPSLEISARFAELVRDLAEQPDLASTASRIAEHCVALLGCRAGMVSRVQGARLRVMAATDSPLCEAVADAENEAGCGPSMQAFRDKCTVQIDDLHVEDRWGCFAPRISHQTSIRAVLVYCLQLGQQPGATLTLYDERPGLFGSQARAIADIYAQHATLALSRAVEQSRAENLEAALCTSREIGVALGVLMRQYGLNQQRAFTLLRSTSQRTHRQLREIAAEVAYTGALPEWAAR